MSAIFRAFDYDGSGEMDTEEFMFIGKALKASKGGDAADFDESEAREKMKKVDTNGDGKIDVNEFVAFFESNKIHKRKEDTFNALMKRYMEAAIRGRADYYFNLGASSRAAEEKEHSDAPQSHKVKVEADARALAHEQSVKYIDKQARKLARRGMIKRTSEYVAEYESAEKHLVRMRRQARAAGNYFAEPEAKVMFVIRIRGMCDMHPKTKKILQLLRLRQIHLGVFLKVNHATQEMIKRVEPYLAFGYPSLKATRELIYKRGFGKVKTTGQAQRLPLTANSQIEEHLGQFGIRGFEDLVHEIYTVGPNFKQANNFLWPFKLNSAKGGLPKKRLGFNEGGQAGNREEYISKLIARML